MILEWSEIIYKSSPEYTRAYEDGYNQAKAEMREMIEALRKQVEAMQALYDASTTEGCGE